MPLLDFLGENHIKFDKIKENVLKDTEIFANVRKKQYLCSQKLQRVSYMDFKILNFTIFCVNDVASFLNKGAKEVYHAMQNAGMIDGYIVPCYDVLHSFSKEYIVEDLVSLMQQKGIKL